MDKINDFLGYYAVKFSARNLHLLVNLAKAFK